MDWFTNLGVLAMLYPDAPALAVDMALNPAVETDHTGFNMAYLMQNAPEQFNAYENFGPFGG